MTEVWISNPLEKHPFFGKLSEQGGDGMVTPSKENSCVAEIICH